MPRNSVLVLGICCASVGLGCSHFVESRAIEHFAKALEDGSLEELKATTSAEFEQRALRLEKALEDFKIVRMPTGDVEIVEVVDVSDEQKKVTVQVGESKRKIQYLLARDEQGKKWVVDDIKMEQTREQDNLTVSMSVTKQMDLLLSVREFVAAWKGDNREEILASVTPELRDVLGKLPPLYLARLTRDAVDGVTESSKPRPSMDEAAAVVRVPRATGEVVLAMKLQEGGWKVSDLGIHTRSEGKEVKSLKMTAHAIDTAVSFLEAYGAEDRARLERTATAKFYTDSLVPADLKSVPLPGADMPPDEYLLSMQDDVAEFRVESDAEVVSLRMERQGGAIDSDMPTDYRVSEVTIFELDGTQQEKRLSAVFTSQAMMMVFADALSKRDLALLKKTSSADFNRRIWEQLDHSLLQKLPIESLGDEPPRVMSTIFNGAVIEITAVHDQKAVTYMLRDWGGAVRVDDVVVPARHWPGSLKTTLEYVLPVHRFASAIEESNLGGIQRNSSSEFNRLVWQQVDSLPGLAARTPGYLQGRLKSIEINGEKALVTLGSDENGAKVMLTTEHKTLVVDEIKLIEGTDPAQQTLVRNTIREQMAQGTEREGGGRAFASRRPVTLPRAAEPATEPAAVEDEVASAPTEQPPAEESVTDFAAEIVPDDGAFADESVAPASFEPNPEEAGFAEPAE